MNNEALYRADSAWSLAILVTATLVVAAIFIYHLQAGRSRPVSRGVF